MWDHSHEKKLCSLQKIQNKAYYFIESARTKDQILLSRLTVEEIITYDLVIVVHMILREMCPENLKG